jgi:hypothetical protein
VERRGGFSLARRSASFVSVAGLSPARANGGPSPTRLDKATAAALATDLEVLLLDDQGESVERCIRIGAPRVDCVVEIGFDGTPENVDVVAVEIVGRRLYVDFYGAAIRTRYTKADSIRVAPPGSGSSRSRMPKRDRNGIYDPEQLADDDTLGWGRPKLPELIRQQCALQPRLPCRR